MAQVLTRLLTDGGGYSTGNSQEVAQQLDAIRKDVKSRIAALNAGHSKEVKEANGLDTDLTKEAEGLDKTLNSEADSDRSVQPRLSSQLTDMIASGAGKQPEFSGSEGEIISRYLNLEDLRQTLTTEIGPGHLRTVGPSIGDSLRSIRGAVYGAGSDIDQTIERERQKASTSFSTPESKQTKEYEISRKSLSYGSKFARTGAEKGKVIANALLREAQSSRFMFLGSSNNILVSSLNDDDTIDSRATAPGRLPLNSIVSIAEQFDSGAGAVTAISKVRSDGLRAKPEPPDGPQVVGFSLEAIGILIKQSLGDFYAGDINKARANLQVAEALLSACISNTPVIGVARDAYEFLSGRDLITGKELTLEDRAMVGWSLVTFGLNRPVNSVLQGLSTSTEALRGLARPGLDRALQRAEDWTKYSDTFRRMSREKGNFSLGSGTRSEADGLGRAYVGRGHTVASDGKTLVHRSNSSL